MKYLLVLFFGALIGCTATQSSVDKAEKVVNPTVSNFPGSWAGIYRGNLEIFTAKGLQQSVAMELEIAPIDSSNRWTWAITYGPDSVTGRRAYELITVDTATGHFKIDEKNSIVLDAFLRENIFVSRFSVMGNLLDCTYEKAGDEIVFTILMGSQTAVTDTGGGVINGDTIPSVQAFPVRVVQRGRLVPF